MQFARLLGRLAVQIPVVIDDPRDFIADDGTIVT